MDMEGIFDLILDNLKKLFFPEDWIDIDMKLSKIELFVLLVAFRKGELTMGMLADGINCPMSTATGIADRLVRKGYLERDRSESDRRVVVVRMTKEGTAVVESLKAVISDYLSFIDENLTTEEKSTLVGILYKVFRLLSQERDKEGTDSDSSNIIEKIDIE